LSVKEKIKTFYNNLISSPLPPPFTLSKKIVEFWDELLKSLYEEHLSKKEVALLATGGYGRKEMSLFSDTDITFLVKKEKETVDEFLYPLWDSGVELSYSVRTPEECIELAKKDIKVKLSLFDSRFLCGSPSLYNHFAKGLNDLIYSKREGFVQGIIELKNERHKKWGGTLYLIEPNIRDAPGGLRDFHTIVWCVKALYREGNVNSMVKCGILSESNARLLRESINFLKKVRNLLHLIHTRKYDILDFESQDRLAQVMGYKDTKGESAAERLMREYFIRTKSIHNILSFVERELLPETFKNTEWHEIGIFYRIGGGKLTLKNPHLLKDEPHRILEIIRLSQEYETPLGERTKEVIMDALKERKNFWNNEKVKRLLKEILNSKNAWFAINEMNESGLLSYLFPPFKKIYRKVQRDLHHIYTVDVHTVFSIREFEILRSGVLEDKLPLATKIAKSLDKPYIVVFSLLFHDIGKGVGTPHAEISAKIARKFAKILELEEADIIEKVIKNHMIFPELSFKRDIYDMEFIRKISEEISSPFILDLLYLHSVCDLRAVHPEAWTEWKHSIMNEFYYRLKEALTVGDFYIQLQSSRTKETKEKVIQLIKEREDAELLRFIDGFEDEYFINFSPEEILHHLKILRLSEGRKIFYEKRDVPDKGYSEIIITGPDEHGIFAKLAGAISISGLNILNALIFSRKDGRILDIFRVTEKGSLDLPRFFEWERFEKILEKVINNEINIKEYLKAAGKPYAKVNPFHEKISINNELSNKWTIVEVDTADRAGLLYTIASTISELGYNIYKAKIVTFGNLASDVFYITTKNGEKIKKEEEINLLYERLKSSVLLKP
jgi:[protein-PII] uridylyltransferase